LYGALNLSYIDGDIHMRVKDIKNEELRKRVEGEQAFICQKEFTPDNPTAELLNKAGLPPGDGFIMLPRDRTIEIGASIEDKEDMVLPSTVLEHLIRNASHRVIIQFCLCRDGMECKDYPIDWGCIFMGDTAKEIDPELGRAVSVEEALAYAAKCREAGLVHMVGRFSPDLRWLNPGVGPIEKLITVCNCCPCCCGMRSVPILKDDRREQTLARMPGVNIEVSDECVGCEECVEQCMFQGIEMQDDIAVITEKCRICGRCVDICPTEAIRIIVKSVDYVKDAIENISSRIDFT
jgi:ferredoxin